MLNKKEKEFCIACRENITYKLEKRTIKKIIKGEEFEFVITEAICDKCGEELNIPGLIDLNISEVDEQYRNYKNLVTINDIKKLMHIYNIGKNPLSIVLGFGEITITRYNFCGENPYACMWDESRFSLT